MPRSISPASGSVALTVSTAVCVAGMSTFATLFPKRLPPSEDSPEQRGKIRSAHRRRFWQLQRCILGVGGALSCILSGVPGRSVRSMLSLATAPLLLVIGIEGIWQRAKPDYDNPLELSKYKEDFFRDPSRCCTRHDPRVVFLTANALLEAVDRFLKSSGDVLLLIQGFSHCPKAPARQLLAFAPGLDRLLLRALTSQLRSVNSLPVLSSLYELDCFQDLVQPFSVPGDPNPEPNSAEGLRREAMDAMTAALEHALTSSSVSEVLSELGGPEPVGRSRRVLDQSGPFGGLHERGAAAVQQALGFHSEASGAVQASKGLVDIARLLRSRKGKRCSLFRLVERAYLPGTCMASALRVDVQAGRCLSDVLDGLRYSCNKAECDGALAVRAAAPELSALMLKEVREEGFARLLAAPGLEFCCRNSEACPVLPAELLHHALLLKQEVEAEAAELRRVEGEVRRASQTVDTISAAAAGPSSAAGSDAEKQHEAGESAEAAARRVAAVEALAGALLREAAARAAYRHARDRAERLWQRFLERRPDLLAPAPAPLPFVHPQPPPLPPVGAGGSGGGSVAEMVESEGSGGSEDGGTSEQQQEGEGEEGREEGQRMRCKVCLEGDLEVVVHPCGHLLMCAACAHRLDSHSTRRTLCPVCRTPVTGFQRVFMA